MPITGKFIADFTAFHDAVKKAEIGLKGMEADANKVQGSLNRMVDQFSGRKVIQEAQLMAQTFELLATKGIGLTNSELQKMGAVGEEAMRKLQAAGKPVPNDIQRIVDAANKVKPAMDSAQASTAGLMSTVQKAAGIFGVAFSAQALVGFVGKVFDAASAIQNLSDSLGLSTDEVQKFKFAAEQGGGSLDDVGNSVQFMQQKLAEGSKETAAALDLLGLKLNEVRQQSPGEALLTVTDAMKGLENPTQQVTTRIDLLGKASKGLGPSIASGFREATEAADIMSKQTIKDLEAAQQAWENLGNAVITISGNIIAGTMRTVKEVTSSWEKFLVFAANASKMGVGVAASLASATAEAAAAAKNLADEAGKVPPVLGKTKVEMEAAAEAAKKLKEAWETYIAGALKRGDAMLTYLKQLEEGFKNVDETVGKFVRGRLKEMGERGEKVMLLLSDAAVQLGLDMAGLHPVIEGIGADFIKALDPKTFKVRELPPEFKKVKDSLGDLSKALSQMATVSGEAFGKVAADLATLISGLKVAKTTGEGFKEGIGQLSGESKDVVAGLSAIGTSAIGMASAFLQATESGNTLAKTLKGAAVGAEFGKAFGPIGSAIGAGIGAQLGFLRGIFGKDEGRKAVEDFAKGLGGFDAIQKQLAIVGKEGEAAWAAFTRARGTEQAKAGIDAVTKALGNVPKALNDMVRAATIAGGGLQASMVPYIQSLIEAGQLTEANANLLMGLPEAGVPSFDAVTKAAENLGLNIDSIGQSIKQMGFADVASGVAADLDTLARAGADMDAVLTGSRDKIQKLVSDAQKFGYSLPESIKPFLQQMVDSGKLTDVFGEKLVDLEDLHFTKPLEKSVEDLIKKLGELVDVIKGDLGGALDDIGKKVVRPRVEVDMPGAAAISNGGRALSINNKTTVTLDGEVVGEAVARQAMRP